jgi:hypothetical protein
MPQAAAGIFIEQAHGKNIRQREREPQSALSITHGINRNPGSPAGMMRASMRA